MDAHAEARQQAEAEARAFWDGKGPLTQDEALGIHLGLMSENEENTLDSTSYNARTVEMQRRWGGNPDLVRNYMVRVEDRVPPSGSIASREDARQYWDSQGAHTIGRIYEIHTDLETAENTGRLDSHSYSLLTVEMICRVREIMPFSPAELELIGLSSIEHESDRLSVLSPEMRPNQMWTLMDQLRSGDNTPQRNQQARSAWRLLQEVPSDHPDLPELIDAFDPLLLPAPERAEACEAILGRIENLMDTRRMPAGNHVDPVETHAISLVFESARRSVGAEAQRLLSVATRMERLGVPSGLSSDTDRLNLLRELAYGGSAPTSPVRSNSI